MTRKLMLVPALSAFVVAIAALFFGLPTLSAQGVPRGLVHARQSPAPSMDMLDVSPVQPLPWAYAGAFIVEGEDSLCVGGNYDEAHIIWATVVALNAGYRTFSEISPRNCNGNVSKNAWAAEATHIIQAVEQDSPNAGVNWGGIMLDEEAGYGYPASDLEDINTWTQAVLQDTAGIAWWLSEDRPVEWYASTYHALTDGSYQSPQVYNSLDPPVLASVCSAYYECEQNITIYPGAYTGCYHTIACASSHVFGSPYTFWLIPGWYNIFFPV